MIADELNKLMQTKAQIKQALIDKGQNPTDEFASYVGNIAGISGGDPFLDLGYPMPESITDAINYGLEFKETWNPNNTQLKPERKIYLPVGLNTSKVTYIYNPDNILYFPRYDLPSYTGTSLSMQYAQYAEFGNLGKITRLSFGNDLQKLVFTQPFNLVKTDNYGDAFDGLQGLKEIVGLEYVNTSGCTNFYQFFSNTKSIKEIDLSKCNWDTSNVTTMRYMFSQCEALEKIDISTFDTSKVTEMAEMFVYCYNLKEVKLPENFGIASTSFNSMFAGGLSKLETVNLENLRTPNGTTFSSMFQQSGLKNIDLSNCDFTKSTSFKSMFDRCENVETIIFPSTPLLEGADLTQMFNYCNSLKYLRLPDVITFNSNPSYFISLRPSDYKYKLVAIDGAVSVKYYGGDLSWTKISGWGQQEPVNSVRKLTVRDLGYTSSITSIYLTTALKKWGIEDPNEPYTQGSRQSLIDTLLTYSFDRANAGYSACSLSMGTDQKALLTEEEIAQITAKGYTIA